MVLGLAVTLFLRIVFDTGLGPPTDPDDDPQDLGQFLKSVPQHLSHLYILLQNDTLALMSIS